MRIRASVIAIEVAPPLGHEEQEWINELSIVRCRARTQFSICRISIGPSGLMSALFQRDPLNGRA
jgi:hypothetical protein